MWHIASGCPKLAQREYRKRHGKVALRVHWELSRRYGLECGERWYEHQPIPVIENEQVKRMWDNTIITDRRVPHNRPDITLVLKDRHPWVMVDRNVVTTEAWKIEWYQDLAFDVKRMHQVEVVVVPLVIGVLGTVSKDFAKWQEYLAIPDITGSVQMSALLGTAHILGKVLHLLAEGAEM